MTDVVKSSETTAATAGPRPVATDPDAPVQDRDSLLKWLPFISTPILILILIGSWQFAVSVIGVSRFILPAPLDVWDSLVDLVTGGTVWYHVWITLYEVLVGFAFALVVGTAVGAILGRVVWLERAVQPALVALQVTPKVAFIPIFVIWFGFGTTSKIIMAGILAFFPIMLNVMLGVRSVDRGHRDVMRGLGASKWATFKSLELPSTLPYIFAGAEVGIVFAVIGAIVGEYLGGSEGLGHLVVRSLNALDAPQLFAVIVLLALMGSLLYAGVTLAKRLMIPWHDSVAGSSQ